MPLRRVRLALRPLTPAGGEGSVSNGYSAHIPSFTTPSENFPPTALIRSSPRSRELRGRDLGPDGSRHFDIDPFRDESGKIKGAINVVQDIRQPMYWVRVCFGLRRYPAPKRREVTAANLEEERRMSTRTSKSAQLTRKLLAFTREQELAATDFRAGQLV